MKVAFNVDDIAVGVTPKGAVSIKLGDAIHFCLETTDALWLSRQLMRMAFILEPPQPKPDAPPNIPNP